MFSVISKDKLHFVDQISDISVDKFDFIDRLSIVNNAVLTTLIDEPTDHVLGFKQAFAIIRNSLSQQDAGMTAII